MAVMRGPKTALADHAGGFHLVLLAALFLAADVDGAIVVITPSTQVQWSGDQAAKPQIDAQIKDINGGVMPTELYKADYVGNTVPREGGPLAANDSSKFVLGQGPKNARITWDGGDFVASPEYLLIKTGKDQSGWYLFDLRDLRNVAVDNSAMLPWTTWSWPTMRGAVPMPSRWSIFGL